MVRKYLITILLLASFFCVFTGCSSKKNNNVVIEYNNSTSVEESTPINADIIEEALYLPYTMRYSMSFHEEFEYVQDKEIFGIIRYSKGKYYTVSKLSDGSFFFMLFSKIKTYTNANNLILSDGFRVKKLIDKEMFKEIQKGTNKNKVLELDPLSYDKETYTIHRFSDKSVIMVRYQEDQNNNLVVKEIVEMDTKNSVLSYLIPQDFALISAK